MMHFMDTATAALATAIGLRVKQQRQSRRWTLDQLAEAAGVSRRMVVNVEQGAANPSVGTLLRLAEALGVGLPVLVEPPRRAPLTITRHGEGPVLWRGDAGGTAVLVAATNQPDVVELWDWTLGPGDAHHGDPHTPGTRELIHVHEGTVDLTVAGERVTLTADDAASFVGDVAHDYANPGTVSARFSLTVVEPAPAVASGG